MAADRAVLIAGATASGKSGLAAAIARARDGVVINADSMQVYRELSVLTARPSMGEEAALPHRLYGHVSASEAYSVGRWLSDVERAIAEVRRSSRLPVIVGGTGLYFLALTEGLSPIPEIPADIRQACREAGKMLPGDELYEELKACDPLTARQLRPSDTQRLVRALEVFKATGRPLADWQSISGEPLLPTSTWTGIVVDRPRDELHRRCDRRFERMMEEGALEEVERLRRMQLDPQLPAMRALGVRPLLDYLEADHPSKDLLIHAVTLCKAETRRYVKRQSTWLKRNMIAWNWMKQQEMKRQADKGFPFIDC